MSRIQPVASEAASQPNSTTSAVDCFGSTTTELRVRVADDVFAEALTPQQIGTSLAQSDQTRKRVSGESAHILPVLLGEIGTEGGDRTRTTLRVTGF